jgi:hypothetical protein
MIRVFGLTVLLILTLPACQEKPLPPADSLDAYVGSWKVTDPQGQVYYMVLKKDGSGSTTRGPGEFGTWKLSGNQIETQWIPKDLKIHFSPGSAKLGAIPGTKSPPSQEFIAERVEKIPNSN